MGKKAQNDTHRSGCPIATSLDLIGDKWTLVIVRDLMNGKARFGEFLTSPEGITTSVLSDRLQRLEAAGLIAAKAYEQRPLRYQYALTEKGLALHAVLRELCVWANQWIPGTWVAPEKFMRRW